MPKQDTEQTVPTAELLTVGNKLFWSYSNGRMLPVIAGGAPDGDEPETDTTKTEGGEVDVKALAEQVANLNKALAEVREEKSKAQEEADAATKLAADKEFEKLSAEEKLQRKIDEINQERAKEREQMEQATRKAHYRAVIGGPNEVVANPDELYNDLLAPLVAKADNSYESIETVVVDFLTKYPGLRVAQADPAPQQQTRMTATSPGSSQAQEDPQQPKSGLLAGFAARVAPNIGRGGDGWVEH